MGAFLIKDIMLLLRDRYELIILLAMPFLLIAILGFSLRGIFSGDLEALEMDVALIVEDDEAQGIEMVQNSIDGMGLPQESEQTLKQAAESASPQTMLTSLLDSEEISGLVRIERMGRDQAEENLEAQSIDAIIIVPDGFTQSALNNILFGASGGAQLELLAADGASPKSDVLVSILEEFVRTVNFESSISRLAGDTETVAIAGGIETITAQKSMTSFQYYTISMAVMFVLFVGSAVARQANLEQRQMVFERIRLSNRPPLLYLSSKAIAAAAIVSVQLMLLFGLSTLLFQTFAVDSWDFWLGIALISVVLAVSVGCLAAFMVALTLRVESDAVPAIFSAGVISLMAFVGGSFVPLDGMPESIRTIGSWTPNGAALSAYFSWMLDPDVHQLSGPLARICAVGVLFLAAALALFPRKGGAA